MRLLDEVVEHLLRHFEVGNHAVFQRLDDSDAAGRAAQHLPGFRADRLHFAGTVIESNGGGLVDHDAPVPGIDPRVNRTQVNRQVRRKQAQQGAQIVGKDSRWVVETHNTNWHAIARSKLTCSHSVRYCSLLRILVFKAILAGVLGSAR